MRLIDADEAIRLVNEEFDGVCVYDVSASQAIDDFENIIYKTPTVNLQEIANKDVNDLPSVQPKQKMGKWIKKMVRGSEELYCSNCGDGIDVIYEYNFCPNCGAKMETTA